MNSLTHLHTDISTSLEAIIVCQVVSSKWWRLPVCEKQYYWGEIEQLQFLDFSVYKVLEKGW